MEKLAITPPALDAAKSEPAKRPTTDPTGSTFVDLSRELIGPYTQQVADTQKAAPQPQRQQNSKLKDLQRLADDAFEEENVRLSITFDKSVGRFIYRGIDRETGEVVSEYPPEEILERIAAMREYAGIIVDRKL